MQITPKLTRVEAVVSGNLDMFTLVRDADELAKFMQLTNVPELLAFSDYDIWRAVLTMRAYAQFIDTTDADGVDNTYDVNIEFRPSFVSMYSEIRCNECRSGSAGTCTGDLHVWQPILVHRGRLFV